MAGFGITSTVSCPVDIDGELRSYTETPYQKQAAELIDEFGNATERTYFGAGNIIEHEAVYALGCDADIGDVTLGEDGVESIGINTSNGDWPTVTVKWYTGLPSCQSGCTFAVTVPSVQGKRKAQALGLSNAGGKVSSSSWTASATLNLLLDGSGDPAGFAFSGGTIECSGEAVGGTWSAGTGITLTSGPSKNESATDYGTTSASGSGILAGTEVSGSSSGSGASS